MKNNLAIAVAVAALGLSVWNASLRPKKLEAPPDPGAARHLTPLPAIDSAGVPGCGDASSLKALMKSQINPTTTHLSFALYHDPREPGTRFKAIAENAGRLLSCIHLAPSLPPAEVGLAGLPDYFRFLGNMQENALGLQIAAMEQDVDASRHWFGHLKQDCVACHSRFRVDPDSTTP